MEKYGGPGPDLETMHDPHLPVPTHYVKSYYGRISMLSFRVLVKNDIRLVLRTKNLFLASNVVTVT